MCLYANQLTILEMCSDTESKYCPKSQLVSFTNVKSSIVLNQWRCFLFEHINTCIRVPPPVCWALMLFHEINYSYSVAICLLLIEQKRPNSFPSRFYPIQEINWHANSYTLFDNISFNTTAWDAWLSWTCGIILAITGACNHNERSACVETTHTVL